MIETLSGILVHREATHLVMDVNGVGYGISVSVPTGDKFHDLNKPCKLFTYLHVKDDSLDLYGFASPLEKKVFLNLISVSGVGPKMALRILSEIQPKDLIQSVLNGQAQQLTRLKGIGKKTAEVLVASLRSTFSKLPLAEQSDSFESGVDDLSEDSIKALMALGVKEGAAAQAVKSALSRFKSPSSAGELIAEALKLI